MSAGFPISGTKLTAAYRPWSMTVSTPSTTMKNRRTIESRSRLGPPSSAVLWPTCAFGVQADRGGNLFFYVGNEDIMDVIRKTATPSTSSARYVRLERTVR
jgi:hypothetical protein